MGRIEKALKKGSFVLLVQLLLLTVFLIFSRNTKSSRYWDLGRLRVHFAEAVNAAEIGDFRQLEKYQCMVIDLEGTVVYSNLPAYCEGERVNLHSLSTGNGNLSVSKSRINYISPLIQQDKAAGFLLANVSALDYQRTPFLHFNELFFPLLFILVAAYLGWSIGLFVKNDILTPIKYLCRLIDELLRGNYDHTFNYKKDSEIGELCEKIKLLRDELYIRNQHARKLQENEKILLASISHDLKTPIAAISGYAEGIRDGIVTRKEDINRYVTIILNRTRHLMALIDHILEDTNSELAELYLNKREVYVRELFQEIINDLKADVQRKGLNIQTGEIPDVVMEIDPIKIYQVFQNIIDNSVKYTPSGGTILIDFGLYEKFLYVEITDNGQGIDAVDVPFIFDHFYRGEKARTQKDIGGSGLGLSIVKQIIKRHGGTIDCDSILEQGTTIRFLLPVF